MTNLEGREKRRLGSALHGPARAVVDVHDHRPGIAGDVAAWSGGDLGQLGQTRLLALGAKLKAADVAGNGCHFFEKAKLAAEKRQLVALERLLRD